jgi:hypothetical protein
MQDAGVRDVKSW